MAHVRDRTCRDKPAKEKRAEQEDPGKACSTTACRQEGQLRPADLSSEQKLEQRGEQPQGEPNQLLRRKGFRTAAPQTQTPANNNNNSLGNNNNLGNNTNNLGTGEQERPPKRPWRILVDAGAELTVAPRSFAADIQLSPLEEDLQLRTANGIAIQTFGKRTAASLPRFQLHSELCDS